MTRDEQAIVDAAAPRVDAILNDKHALTETHQGNAMNAAQVVASYTRAPRRDKGTKRPPKPKSAKELVTLNWASDLVMQMALLARVSGKTDLAFDLLMQVIEHQQKRIDSLTAQGK